MESEKIKSVFYNRGVGGEKEVTAVSSKPTAKIVEVIMTENIEGKGTPESPVCQTRRYWTKDGMLIAEMIWLGEGVKPEFLPIE